MMSPGIVDHKGKSHGQICAPINIVKEAATKYEDRIAVTQGKKTGKKGSNVRSTV